MMLVEIQTALCILSLLGKRRGGMQAKKTFFLFTFFFYCLISGCVLFKSKLHKTENFCHSLLVMGLSKVSH